MPKQKKRRLADYSTSEMVKLCGMKASSTFENKRDKVFERYEIDPTLFKMDSSIEGGENFYPEMCIRDRHYIDHGLQEHDGIRELVHGKVYSDIFKQIIVLAASEFEIMSKALCSAKGCLL